MNNNQKKAYTSKEILTIAYPILISLVMEQAIGMTDTAFLGRVGEIELGASAIAGVYYIAIFMIGFGFSIGSQIPGFCRRYFHRRIFMLLPRVIFTGELSDSSSRSLL